MDPGTLSRWQALVDRFDLDKNGASPWDAKELEAGSYLVCDY